MVAGAVAAALGTPSLPSGEILSEHPRLVSSHPNPELTISCVNSHAQQAPSDPTVSGPWAHDMHEAVAEPARPRPPPRRVHDEGPPNGNGHIPVCAPNPTPINRKLSIEKHVGNAQVRVFIPPMKAPVVVPGLQVMQYTKLPDHRPPLRRDKPVRISLPDNPPRYVVPAVDRSFIFIPRALRPPLIAGF